MKSPSALAWMVVVAVAATSAPVDAATEASNGHAVANGRIFMDSNIIPSYEASTTALERKFDLPIGLWRIDRHWRGLSISDALNVPSNFWKPLVKIQGLFRVSQFYNTRALPCLHKQNMFGLYRKKEFIQVMNKVAECLYPGIKTKDNVDIGVNDPVSISKEDLATDVATQAPTVAPVPTVAPTAAPVVTEAPKPIITSSPVVTRAAEPVVAVQPVEPTAAPVVPESVRVQEPVIAEPSRVQEPVIAEPSRIQEPVIAEPSRVQEPVIVENPLVPSIQEPVEPAQPLEPSLPSEPSQPEQPVEPFTPLDVPGTDNEPAAEPIGTPLEEPVEEPAAEPVPTRLPVPTYFFNPASTEVAPFFALDVNQDQRITPDEWPQYVAHVREVAWKAISKGQNPTAVKLLQLNTDFHYNALTHCIDARLFALEQPTLDDSTAFNDFAKWVENNCNVKFRFSLLAGPPPFEWIAKDKPVIAAADITRWLTPRLSAAKKDLASRKILTATSDQIRAASDIVKCALDILNGSGDAVIDRDAYYTLLGHISRCASS